MIQPSLYTRANDVQRHDAREIIDEFKDTLQENSNGRDSLVDIGTGTGDVLVDMILPILPKNFTKIVGLDISADMVKHAKARYAHCDRVDFKQLDIEMEKLPLEFQKQFDHATSFYCLHWIQDQRKSVENIYESLRPNGDCLLVFLSSNFVYDVYKLLSKDEQWSEYMTDLDRIICPFHNRPKAAREYDRLLEEAGFVNRRVETRNKVFTHEGLENFKENMRAINPFLSRIPKPRQEDFLTAFCDYFEELGYREKIANTDDYRFSIHYKLMVAYARKSPKAI